VFTALGVAAAPAELRGEVEDLEEELPPYLRPALEDGLRESSAAKPMSLEEYIAHVAEREGANPQEARAHARRSRSAARVRLRRGVHRRGRPAAKGLRAAAGDGLTRRRDRI
jgi:hypothetical protein